MKGLLDKGRMPYIYIYNKTRRVGCVTGAKAKKRFRKKRMVNKISHMQ